MSIYAALRVPEVWRWAQEELLVYLLDESGAYKESSLRQALPGFPFGRVVDLLRRRAAADATTLIREFRDWVRELVSSAEGLEGG
jgi:hypothetical protein